MDQGVEQSGAPGFGLGHRHPDDALVVLADRLTAGQDGAAAVDVEHQVSVDDHAVVADVEPMAVDLVVRKSTGL